MRDMDRDLRYFFDGEVLPKVVDYAIVEMNEHIVGASMRDDAYADLGYQCHHLFRDFLDADINNPAAPPEPYFLTFDGTKYVVGERGEYGKWFTAKAEGESRYLYSQSAEQEPLTSIVRAKVSDEQWDGGAGKDLLKAPIEEGLKGAVEMRENY